MNERIRELAKQANIRFGRMAVLDGDPRGMARFVSYSEFEKFAELIIKECLDVMDTTSKKALEQFTYMGDDVPTFHHQFEVMKHFGVEKHERTD